jgi:hypothetical protein
MRAIAFFTGLLLTGCSAAAPLPPAADPPASPGRAHDLVMHATSCWMGGLWSDALGEKDEARLAGIRQRCEAVLESIGMTPEERYFPLRAVEPYVVEAIAKRVQALAGADPAEAPHAAELVVLLHGIADAARETGDARRAADVVKDDVELRAPLPVGAADRSAAAAKLQANGALDALFHLDAGPYTEEARTVALLTALDRMEIARGLPKHLKLYAVRGAYVDVFGVPPPPVGDDAAAPIRSGTWLGYLTQVATAAGHPVPSDARDPQNREPLAWTGVLAGFADRLRADEVRVGASPLADIERAIVARLDEESKNARVVYEAHALQDR